MASALGFGKKICVVDGRSARAYQRYRIGTQKIIATKENHHE